MQVTHIDYLGNQMSLDNQEYLKELNAKFDISDEKIEAERIKKQELLNNTVNVEEALTIADNRPIEEKLASIKKANIPNLSTDEIFTLTNKLKQQGDTDGTIINQSPITSSNYKQ